MRETIGYLRRTFSRLDVTSRSLFALIEEGSCFAGTLFELALACDRIYHLALPDDPARAPKIAVSAANFGDYPMASGQSRLGRRFYDEKAALEAVKAKLGAPLDAAEALQLGLATSTPDDIDWSDEVRLAVEERVSLSPDALTAMEANLRFDGPETMATRVFGRLSAWQNWMFQRPNAVGEKGALKVYGKGEKAAFDWNRVLSFGGAASRRPARGTRALQGERAHGTRRRLGHPAAPDRPGNLHPLQHLRGDLPGRRDHPRRRNYVVNAAMCDLCMACIPPCPTGSIDNWRVVPRASAYSVEAQFGWDALPAELTAEELAAAGVAIVDAAIDEEAAGARPPKPPARARSMSPTMRPSSRPGPPRTPTPISTGRARRRNRSRRPSPATCG